MTTTPPTRPGGALGRPRPVPAGADDGVALVMALLTILVASALSLLVLGTVLAQVTPTQFERKNARTGHAAEAGIDTALGRFRDASTTVSGQVVGDRTKLPCTAGTSEGLVAGNIKGSPGQLAYSVRVRYYRASAPTTPLSCASTGGLSVAPDFALLTATGTGAALPARTASFGDRTVEARYDFRRTNANIAGGLVRRYKDSATTLDLCFDAGSATPAAGTALRVRVCDPSRTAQYWSWRPDMTIVLASTQTAAGSGGMCVHGYAATSTTWHVPLTLEPCVDGDFKQKWGLDDDARFAGRLRNTTASSGTYEYCIYLPSPDTDGSTVRAGVGDAGCNLGSGSYNRIRTWNPDRGVGAGRVGSVTGAVSGQQLQWGNFKEFSRCFDVTDWVWDRSYMMAFPCKQDVNGTVGWNQTLQWDEATGYLYTYAGATGQTFTQAKDAGSAQKCLRAPTTDGGRVLLTTCSTTEPRHRWKVYRQRATYATSFTIEDDNGRCLSLGAPAETTGFYSDFSTIISETCDGGDRQKWNAPPDPGQANLRDTRELD